MLIKLQCSSETGKEDTLRADRPSGNMDGNIMSHSLFSNGVFFLLFVSTTAALELLALRTHCERQSLPVIAYT